MSIYRSDRVLAWEPDGDEKMPEQARDTIERLQAEIDRLRDEVKSLRETGQALQTEAGRQCALKLELLAALKPFAVPDKESLVDTLGHIGRAEIANARIAVAKAEST